MEGFFKSSISLVDEDWDEVVEYNTCLERLIASRKDQVIVEGLLATSKTAWRCAILQQAMLYRITMLARGCADAWNASNVLCSILAARALVESIALAQWIADSLEKKLADNDMDAVEDISYRQLFTTRDKKQIADQFGFEATNILTLIDRFDRKIKGARGAYDFLSEFCHPNGSGHLFTFGTIEKATGNVSFAEAAPRVKGVQGHVITCFMLLLFVERIMDVFDRIIPVVADRDPYSGKWS